jgi:hypothetical protein
VLLVCHFLFWCWARRFVGAVFRFVGRMTIGLDVYVCVGVGLHLANFGSFCLNVVRNVCSKLWGWLWLWFGFGFCLGFVFRLGLWLGSVLGYGFGTGLPTAIVEVKLSLVVLVL